MKISLNWAAQVSSVDLSAIGVDKLVEKIGAQLGAVDEVEEWGPRFEGIKVVKVISCQKHPDADKLSLCTLDDGGNTPDVKRDANNHVEVVCGAPNVRADMLAVWIPPGATVPNTLGKDPFTIEAREIRGRVSNGMLASAAELGISEDHSGILEISAQDVGDELANPGTPFKKLFRMDDVVIDVENKMFTHRPDLFGVLGDAREIAGIQGLAFRSPDWYSTAPEFQTASGLPLEVSVEDYELTPRFMAVAMKDVQVGSSPMWLQAALTRVGLKPINNIVDVTNFLMHLTGQPLHAYDYDKVKARSGGGAPVLIARKANKDEPVALLNGKTINISDPAIVIATDKQVVGVAGIMGGADTEVDTSTKNIILECANFNMYAVRRASMKYGLFTDAVTRFTKGQSVLQNDRVLAQAMQYVQKLAGGQQASNVLDAHQDLPQLAQVEVPTEFVNQRLGLQLDAQAMKKLLENVEFTVEEQGDTLKVRAPFWRTDIEIPEDIVEEIGRLYGYDHLPQELPKRRISPATQDILLEVKAKGRDILADGGANEILTYSFVHGNLFEKVGQNKDNAFELANALSPDLQYYRMSLLPSILDKVHGNIKAGYSEFALFEINQVHNKDLVENNLPVEEYRVGFVYVADDKVSQGKAAAYYQARYYLERVLHSFGVEAIFEPAISKEPSMEVGKAAIAPFDRNRAAYVRTKDGELLAELGEVNAATRRNLKLPKHIAGFELDLEGLLKASRNLEYVPLSRFPSVEQDISLKIPAEVPYQALYDALHMALNELRPQATFAGLTPLDIFQRSEDTAHKQLAFRLNISSYERTLKGEEINTLLDKVADIISEKFHAERI
jgi:phenylalanyl-tRNA synthetase beta chain